MPNSEVYALRLQLSDVVTKLVDALGYIRALEVIDRECRLVKIGQRAQQLESTPPKEKAQ